MNTFTIGNAVQTGWKVTKDHLGLFIGIVLTSAVVNIAFNAFGSENADSATAFIAGVLGYLVQLTLELGIIAVTLKVLDAQPVKYTDIFKMYPLLLQGVIATILAGIAVTLGIILLIIPGIYIALRLSLALYVLVDEKVSGIDALKKSWELTRGHAWQLFLLGLTLVGLNIVGALLLLVGLLITIPITMVAGAYVYRQLHSQASALQAPVITPATPQVA